MQSLIVRAVIELGVETTIVSEDTRGGRLASDILTYASKYGYIRTPDGWFVPIRDLLHRMEDVAEFLHVRTLQSDGEFELGGGFEILTGGGQSLGLPRSALFPLAMLMADTLINLRDEDDVQSVFVSNQDIWDMSLRASEVKIETRQIAAREHQVYWLPHKELAEHLMQARLEVNDFAMRLEPLLLGYRDIQLTPKIIRQMFGLQ